MSTDQRAARGCRSRGSSCSGARPAATATWLPAGATTAIASPRCAPCAASSASRGCRPSTEPISSASAGPAQRGSSTPCQVSAGVRGAAQPGDQPRAGRRRRVGGDQHRPRQVAAAQPLDAEVADGLDRAPHLRAGGGQRPQQPLLVALLEPVRRRRAAPRRSSSRRSPAALPEAVRAGRRLVEQQHRDAVVDREASTRSRCTRARRAVARLLAQRRRGRRSGRRAARAGRRRSASSSSAQPRIAASASSRTAAMASAVGPSTLRRSSGSVFDARTLNHVPSGSSTVSPSSSSIVGGAAGERRAHRGDPAPPGRRPSS